MFMTCMAYIKFFIKWSRRRIQLCSKSMIFLMFHQSYTALIKTPVKDYINEIAALFADKSFQPYLTFLCVCVYLFAILFFGSGFSWCLIFLIFTFWLIIFKMFSFLQNFLLVRIFLVFAFFYMLFLVQDFPHIDFFHIFFLVQDMQDMSQ